MNYSCIYCIACKKPFLSENYINYKSPICKTCDKVYKFGDIKVFYLQLDKGKYYVGSTENSYILDELCQYQNTNLNI